jgi:hypothetical protein
MLCALLEVEHWMGSGPNAGYQPQSNCECQQRVMRVRRRGLSFVVERETAQITG